MSQGWYPHQEWHSVCPASMPCWPGFQCSVSVLMTNFSPHAPGHGTPEFLRRQRLLALCGWGVQQLRTRAAAGPGSGPEPSPGPASTTPAADAALTCALCGAKAGMWQFVPRVAAACSSLSGAGLLGVLRARALADRRQLVARPRQPVWPGSLLSLTFGDHRCAWVRLCCAWRLLASASLLRAV